MPNSGRQVHPAIVGDVVLPGAAAGQMPPLEKLVVVHHPERAEVVLVPDEALVQRQVGAYRVLHQLKKREEEEDGGEGIIGEGGERKTDTVNHGCQDRPFCHRSTRFH